MLFLFYIKIINACVTLLSDKLFKEFRFTKLFSSIDIIWFPAKFKFSNACRSLP